MKTQKLFLSALLVLLAMMIIKPANAQRCAVLEFKAGSGISQSEVDGISAIFITYFQPAGYTMVERTQIDKVISEQGFQRSNLTQSQMVRIGQILNVSKIVVGDINYVFGQYQVDVRAIDVETGTIAATEGSTFATSSYRSSMQSVAQKLAGKIAITPGPAVQSSTYTPKKRSTVEVLYGYLKIFPTELGSFSSEPISVINQINSQAQYGYNNWRIPTNEELSLMRANNYLGSGEYMTRDNKRGIVLLVTDGEDYSTISAKQERQRAELEAEQERQMAEQERQRKAAAIKAQGLVDLGLPSGTLWKDKNEDGGFYTYDQAVNKFGNKLPAKEQFEELRSYCQWTWTGRGYKVTGPNGNSITLPAAGGRNCDGSVYSVGSSVEYWSSTPTSSSCCVYNLQSYLGNGVHIENSNRCFGKSVRLVYKP